MRQLLLTATVFLASSVSAQDPPKREHNSTDPYKCKSCAPALAKALEFLDKKGGGADGHRQCLMGMLYLADGRQPAELERCVKRVSGGFYKQGGFNGNWSVAMAAIFLSEVYKRQPTDLLKAKLLD